MSGAGLKPGSFNRRQRAWFTADSARYWACMPLPRFTMARVWVPTLNKKVKARVDMRARRIRMDR